MQSHQKHEQMPEEQYSYYRRCQRFRQNGQQCKAPAMKNQDVCYKHEEQAAAEHRRQTMIQSLQLPPVRDLTSALQTIQIVAQAVIDDRIDQKTAGKLMSRLQRGSLAAANPQPRAAALHKPQSFKPQSLSGSSLPIIFDLADKEL